jgi:hypothetical protein
LEDFAKEEAALSIPKTETAIASSWENPTEAEPLTTFPRPFIEKVTGSS